jgi:hypothetical protein
VVVSSAGFDAEAAYNVHYLYAVSSAQKEIAARCSYSAYCESALTAVASCIVTLLCKKQQCPCSYAAHGCYCMCC